MDEELEKKFEALMERLDGERNKKSFFQKYLGSAIVVVTLVAGMIASYSTLKADVGVLKSNVSDHKLVQERHTKEIQDVKLKGVQDSTNITNIKEKVNEINNKIDRLLENPQ